LNSSTPIDTLARRARAAKRPIRPTIPRGEAGNREQVQDPITDVLDELRLRCTIVELGLHDPVGTRGSRLSEAQRQKMANRDSGLKAADLIAFSDATTARDSETGATMLQTLKDELAGCSLFCSLHRTPFAPLSTKSWSWSKAASLIRDA
jgi:hypothetical protein